MKAKMHEPSPREAALPSKGVAASQNPDPKRSPGFTSAVWLLLSSERATAVLVMMLAGMALIGALVPQAQDAIELAKSDHATRIHALAIWGLTDIIASSWARAVAILLLANLFFATIRSRGMVRFGVAPSLNMPSASPHRSEVSAMLPERAVEALRDAFRARFGAPVEETAQGSRVVMVFDTGPGARRASTLNHLGLALLVLGAGLSTRPPPDSKRIARAKLEVKDSRTGYVGIFDLAANEPTQFFQWKATYVLRDYVRSRHGLGPAVRFERQVEEERRVSDFWVYLDAPPEFDVRHRKGEVSFRALEMGLVPMPGSGLASSGVSVLLVLGMGMLAMGVVWSRRPHGRLWIEADGDRVTLIGVPERELDHGFSRGFERWALCARAAVDEL